MQSNIRPYIQSLCVRLPKKTENIIQTKGHFQKITKIFANKNFPFYSTIMPWDDMECPRLASLVKILKVLPHSNADPERLFSMVQKIETENCTQLKPETTCHLLRVKMNDSSPCHASRDLLSPALLKDAKSATMRSLATPQSGDM